jgi:hypothetical protein
MKTGQVSLAMAALAVAITAWAHAVPEGPAIVAQATSQDQKAQQDLQGMEKAGQRDDMQPMTAAQQAQYKAEYDAAKAKWDKLSPTEKQALRKSAWQKKRADLNAMEAVGQRDDSYVLPL